MKGICEDCGTYDELYKLEILGDRGQPIIINVCKDCYDEATERDHDIFKE